MYYKDAIPLNQLSTFFKRWAGFYRIISIKRLVATIINLINVKSKSFIVYFDKLKKFDGKTTLPL